MHRWILTAFALCAAPAFAQASAVYASFGNGSGPGSYGQHLVWSGIPRLGSTISIGVDYTSTTVSCATVTSAWGVWLVTGLSSQTWNGLPLPATLPQGFTLLVSPDFINSQVTYNYSGCPPGLPNGVGPFFNFAIPSNSGLLGVSLYQQILMATVTPGSQFYATPIATDGGAMFIWL